MSFHPAGEIAGELDPLGIENPEQLVQFDYEVDGEQPVDEQPTEEPVEVPDDELYWADRKGEALARALEDKEEAFYSEYDRGGFREMHRRQYAQYYGRDLRSMNGTVGAHSVQSSGQDGEQLIFRLNEARSIISMQIQTTIGERASFQCVATNNDYQSTTQVESCDDLVNYTYRTTHAEQKERLVFESDSNFGSAFGWVRWDPDGGQKVTIEQPANPDDPDAAPQSVTQKSGSPIVSVVYPWDMVQEPNASEHLWRMCRERRSKWELAAKWPEYADRLKAMQGLDRHTVENLFGLYVNDLHTDDVIVKHFYHADCEALPGGRYVVIVGDIILMDETCPTVSGLPIVEMCSERYIGTAFGYANAWMLNPANQMIDQLLSDTATNLSVFGRQTLAMTEGSEFDMEKLANGTTLMTIPVGGEAPQALLYAQMPEPVKWVLEFLLRRMEALSGVNGVVRGDPATNISSGSMAALFHEISVKYMGFRQVARDFYREEMANLLLDFMKANAKGAFVAQIVGENNRPYLKQFSMDEVSGVRRVLVKTRNPMLESPHGRLELMMATAQIQNPEDRRAAINLILTGDTSEFTDSDQSETNAIKWENEMLSEATPVPVLQFDSHKSHYKEHKAAFNKRREEFILDYLQELQKAEQLGAQVDELRAVNPMLADQMEQMIMMQGQPTTAVGRARKALLDHIVSHANMAMQQHPMMAQWNEEPLPNLAPQGAMGGGGGGVGGSSAALSTSASGDPAASAGVSQPEPAQPAQAPGGAAPDQGDMA